MDNPLLRDYKLPPFKEIELQHMEEALQKTLEDYKKLVEKLVENGDFSWQDLVLPLEEQEQALARVWSPISHLNSVRNSPELRKVYEKCLPALSDFHTWLGQHEGLCAAYKSLKEGGEWQTLNTSQQKVIENILQDFRLAGVDLPAEKKKRFAELSKRLAELSNQFANNRMDATRAWTMHIEDEAEIEGVPALARSAAANLAATQGKKGWVFTLDMPSYLPVLSYAKQRELRRKMYQAFIARASELGPDLQATQHPERDNSRIIEEILALRSEEAQLLGLETYAHLSLESKMAKDPVKVLDFLQDLGRRCKPQAQAELESLKTWARKEDGIEDFSPWDMAYYSEKLREAEYSLQQEELRPWFSVPSSIEGLFRISGKLFDIEFREDPSVEAWHEDVQFYWLERRGKAIAGCYLDLYARQGKQGGAWMDVCQTRYRRSDGALQLPIAYLTCNFPSPQSGPEGIKPSLLTHDEVCTLFHEFGHGLHHMLSQEEEASVSGVNGVQWDAVELPSQFMENFCWEDEGLAMLARHYESGEALPKELQQRLLAAKNFNSALQMCRQLEFALFDMRLHCELSRPSQTEVAALLREVQQQVNVVPQVAFNRFTHSFSHIFAGSYAAGYYSYKWAEVLSADAFSAFEEEGVFNPQTGRRFANCILERGGSREAMELFAQFRGREPQIDALLRHNNISMDGVA